ncbi:MAG: 4-(cytidine 5'-diphospho)-2-C-methyl-D-erythritol kinase [Bacteroidota bacterium]
MTLSAPAKLNLGLHVLRRRADGYHDLDTIFVRIDWADEVRVETAETFRFTCSDPTLPTDESNLCVKAAHALALQAGIEPNGHLHLEKRLPYGAGLGGGSSDAASTLRLLDAFWGTQASDDDLHALATSLGSDIPFFLGTPAMYGTGRGELLSPLRHADGKPYTCPFTFVVLMPDAFVSTGEAYGAITPNDESRPDLVDLVTSNDLTRWNAELVNDFEAPIMARHPVIAEAKQRLEQLGAGYAAMTGSGAAVFGVFESEEKAEDAANALRGARAVVAKMA